RIRIESLPPTARPRTPQRGSGGGDRYRTRCHSSALPFPRHPRRARSTAPHREAARPYKTPPVVAIAPASPAAAVPGSWVVASDGLVHDDLVGVDGDTTPADVLGDLVTHRLEPLLSRLHRLAAVECEHVRLLAWDRQPGC